jgi:2-polyprenyl-3-methyl-5-hydroxy-6-metoxy-1,4-benzoquinol methylase
MGGKGTLVLAIELAIGDGHSIADKFAFQREESAMSSLGRQAHWENVYATKAEHTVSWFQESPDISLDLVRATEVGTSASIIDVGGGASRLIDALVDKGFKALTVLDLSEKALAASKARLGARSTHVQWVVADITTWEPSQTYDVWHDRAALHFLTDPKIAPPMPKNFLKPSVPAAT